MIKKKKERKNSDSVLTEIYDEYRDPIFFVEHALGHVTWSQQRKILQSVKGNEKTAVRACHGVSKTFAAAEIVTWFLNCFDNSKVITTAPTHTQVKDLLWAEIGAIYRTSRIRLEGECLTTYIKTDKSEHYAIGFSTDKPQRAEGWHAPAILFIFDEAKGIPQWLWDSVSGLLTGGFYRWLAISTTDGVNPGDQFEKCFKEDSEWNKIHISAHDSPYVTGEKFRGIKIEDAERLDKFEAYYIDPKDIVIQIATPKWIKEREEKWGKDSILFLTKVKGEIDRGGTDTIIKLSQIIKMFDNAKLEDFDDSGDLEAGVDVARGGDDDTVFFKRKGMKIIDYRIIPSKSLPEKEKLEYISDQLEIFVDQNKKMRIKTDDTGVGGGVTDIMQRREYNVVPVNFQQNAKDGNHFSNAISEMWYEAAKIIDKIACPFDPAKNQDFQRLQAELVNRKRPTSSTGVVRALDSKGRLQIESKEAYKKRTKFKSPDMADAFLLAFYDVRGGKRAIHILESSPPTGDWEQEWIQRKQRREQEPGDIYERVKRYNTPENAKRFKELMAEHRNISKVAKLMNIPEADLRLWASVSRDYINAASRGDSGKGIEVI